MATPRRRQPAPAATPAASRRAQLDAAAALHSAVIRLLRRVRTEDEASGLTPPRGSALSVLVFAGPMTLGQLARAEQVQPPTISRLIQDMVRARLVRLEEDPDDARIRRVHATALGKRLMLEGRDRRVRRIAAALGALPPRQQNVLAEAAAIMAELAARI